MNLNLKTGAVIVIAIAVVAGIALNSEFEGSMTIEAPTVHLEIQKTENP